jgi:putative acetyltransferase
MRTKSSCISANDAERYVLRRAAPEDAAGIWRLISSVLSDFGIVADRKTTDRDLADIGAHYDACGGVFFVLLDGRTVIGTVALRPGPPEACELCRMYLAHEYRGRGLGRRLFDHAMAEARRRGFQEVFLKTASVLTTAISLYERAGFQHVPKPEVCGNCDRMMRMRLAKTGETPSPGPGARRTWRPKETLGAISRRRLL